MSNSSTKLGVRNILYWIGVAAAVGCIVLVLAGNAKPVWQVQGMEIPLAWVAGAVAILAFLADEYCDSESDEAFDEVELSPEALYEEVLS